MVEIPRAVFTKDSVFSELHSRLIALHKAPLHTEKTLVENRHVKDFCVEARHFVFMGGKNPLYIHYDVANWLVDGRLKVTFDTIAVYDSFMEYETARMKQLHGAKDADIPNIN